MEPYNPNAKCGACGGDMLQTQYATDAGGPFIGRRCLRCGYAWREAPLNQPPNQATTPR